MGVLTVRDVRFPTGLNQTLAAVIAASQDETPEEALASTMPELMEHPEFLLFADELRAKLDSNGAAQVVGVDPPSRYRAFGLAAIALGGLAGEAPGSLGGELTKVVTSTTFDHNLAWHTDSTSWEMPNRWQLLCLTVPDRWGRAAPTSLLPWSTVLASVTADAANELARVQYAWREQFPTLRPLFAPILGRWPRWLRPALASSLTGTDAVTPAIAEVDRVIAGATQYVDIELTLSSFLVFDNHAMLHRGPHLVPDGGRSLVRLKLGGLVGELAPE